MFDCNAAAGSSRRGFANRRTDNLVTDASPGRQTPFAIEELPPELLSGAVLEVDEERYVGEDIRRLYDSADFSLLPQAAA